MTARELLARGELPELLSGRQVADLFHVDPHTVSAWTRAGKWPAGSVEDGPAGRRYRRDVVLAALRGDL